MEEKIIEKVKETIKPILEEEMTEANLNYLDKLVDIYKDIKEVKSMNYGNYGNYGGRRPGHGSYGEYDGYGRYGEYRDSYGRRGYDMKYRGDDYTDRMSGEYHRYMESRERYGAGEESDKAFHFMTKALGEYIEYLHEEAETPQQKQMLNETIQRSMR